MPKQGFIYNKTFETSEQMMFKFEQHDFWCSFYNDYQAGKIYH